jgi:hypothetical protein
MDREELGRKVMEASQACAEGYKRGITSFSTDAEKDVNEKCAIAASNTGWFILQSLGFSNEEKRALFDSYSRS